MMGSLHYLASCSGPPQVAEIFIRNDEHSDPAEGSYRPRNLVLN